MFCFLYVLPHLSTTTTQYNFILQMSLIELKSFALNNAASSWANVEIQN